MPLQSVSSFQQELGRDAPVFTSTLTLVLAFRLARMINDKPDNIWIVLVTVFLMLYVISLLTRFIVQLEHSMIQSATSHHDTATISGATILWVKCIGFMIVIAQNVLMRLLAVLTTNIVTDLPPDGPDTSNPLHQDLPIAILYLAFAFLGTYVIGAQD
jgi:hypothetical protein